MSETTTTPQWGCPWNGLYYDGDLLLENGQTIEWSASLGIAGDTLYQKMPWAPTLSITPEQEAADLAAGRNWRDYFLLTGENHRVYGQFSPYLSGMSWVYAGPDNQPWYVSIEGLNVFSAGFDGYVEAQLFGVFGADPQTHSAALVLADNGQQGGLPSIQLEGYNLPQARSFRLLDILPDGSKAIFCLGYGASSGVTSAAALGFIPTGFWLVELTGTPGVDFAAAVSVLYTRDQALGSLSDTGDLVERPLLMYSSDKAASADPYIDPPAGEMCTITGQIINPLAAPSAGTFLGFGFDIPVGESARTLQVSNQVIACWFRPGTAIPVPVLADTRLHWLDQLEAPAQAASGTSSGVREGQAIPSRTGKISYSISYEHVARREFEISISYDGDTISDYIHDERRYFGGGSYEGEIRLINVDDEYRVAAGWLPLSVTSAGTRTVETPAGTTTATIPFNSNVRPLDEIYRGAMNDTRHLYLIEPERFFSHNRDAQDDTPHEVGAVRYSNNAIAMLRRTGTPGNLTTWTHGSSITPQGIIAGSITVASTARYGTWHPFTHALERGYSQPVGWI